MLVREDWPFLSFLLCPRPTVNAVTWKKTCLKKRVKTKDDKKERKKEVREIPCLEI